MNGDTGGEKAELIFDDPGITTLAYSWKNDGFYIIGALIDDSIAFDISHYSGTLTVSGSLDDSYLCDGGSNAYYTAGDWNDVIFEFNNTTHQWRYNINDAGFTSWNYGCYDENPYDLVELLQFWDNTYGTKYFDNVTSGETVSLSVDYPVLDETNNALVQPHEAFPVRFAYSTDVSRNFTFGHCSDSSCDTVDYYMISGTTNANDPYHTGLINTTVETILDQTDYYEAVLYDGLDPFITIEFSLTGSYDISSQAPAIEGPDLGFWGNLLRNLFVPDSSFIATTISDLTDATNAKFGTIIEARDYLFAALSDPDPSEFEWPELSVFGSTPTPIFTTTDDIDDAFSTIRTWVGYLLWLFFIIYLIKDIPKIFKP